MLTIALALALAGQGEPPPSAAAPVGEITHQAWRVKPSREQVEGHYPYLAGLHEQTGAATVHCSVEASGDLTNCVLVCETPKGWNFGVEALQLARFYQMQPTLPDGRSVAGGTTTLSMVFGNVAMRPPPRCDKTAKP